MSLINRKVLVIDDDPTVCKLLVLTLGKSGFSSTFTTNAKEGLELVRTQPVDAVISDILMPEMTGLELLETLRGEGVMTPFLIISSQSGRDNVLAALRLGAFDLIGKPFQASVIYQLLDEAIRVGKRQKQLTQMRMAAGVKPGGMETSVFWTLANVATISAFDSSSLDQKTLEVVNGKDGLALLLASSVHALTNSRRSIENLKNFQSRVWDLGALTRVIHGLRTGFEAQAVVELMPHLLLLERCYAWLRVRPEDLATDIIVSLGMAHDELIEVFKTMQLDSSVMALEKLEKAMISLDLRFQKINAKAAS